MLLRVPAAQGIAPGTITQTFMGFEDPDTSSYFSWVTDNVVQVSHTYNSVDQSVDIGVTGFGSAIISLDIDFDAWFYDDNKPSSNSGYSSTSPKIFFGCKVEFSDVVTSDPDAPVPGNSVVATFGMSSINSENHVWDIFPGRGGSLSCRAGSWSISLDNTVYYGDDIGRFYTENGNTLYLGFGIQGANTIGSNVSVTYLWSVDGETYTPLFQRQNLSTAFVPSLNFVYVSLHDLAAALSPATAHFGEFSAWYPSGLLSIVAKETRGSLWVPVTPTSPFISPQVDGGAPSPGGFIEVVTRATTGWPFESVPYSQSSTYNPGPPYINGYRADCSGFASMAANVPTPGPNTVGFVTNGWISRINWSDLLPGDFVGHCGPGTGGDAGHIMVVTEVDHPGGTYTVWEQNGVGLGPHENTYTIGDDLGNSFAPYRLSAFL